MKTKVQSAECKVQFRKPCGLDYMPAVRFYNGSKGEAFSDIELCTLNFAHDYRFFQILVLYEKVPNLF